MTAFVSALRHLTRAIADLTGGLSRAVTAVTFPLLMRHVLFAGRVVLHDDLRSVIQGRSRPLGPNNSTTWRKSHLAKVI